MSQEEVLKSIMSGAAGSKPPGASRNAFNPVHHQKPLFKTNGTEVDCYYKLNSKNIIAEQESLKVPKHWKESINHLRTNTELTRKRREAKLPDPSFDLNGDGTVSAKEYAISKMFDLDFDGKLSPEEKVFCLKRLKEGFESKTFYIIFYRRFVLECGPG